jgi:hypothetical protein
MYSDREDVTEKGVSRKLRNTRMEITKPAAPSSFDQKKQTKNPKPAHTNDRERARPTVNLQYLNNVLNAYNVFPSSRTIDVRRQPAPTSTFNPPRETRTRRGGNGHSRRRKDRPTADDAARFPALKDQFLGKNAPAA